MRDTRILSEEIINIENLPSAAKEFSNYSFWHYTQLQTVDKILKNGTFRLGSLAEMNDKNEEELYPTDKAYIHTLCFCNSNTEKIPMWYLYSGISGNGAAIGITPSAMLNFIRSINKVKTSTGNTLVKGKDFELNCGWVCYRRKDNPLQVFYRNKWYVVSNETIEKTNYFIKDYPWEYEREFRIVIKNKTKIPYDYLEIEWTEDLYKRIKTKLAPEIKEAMFLKLMPELEGFHVLMSKKIQESQLSINMNLCKRNFDSFVSYIESDDGQKLISKNKNADRLYKAISHYIKFNGKNSKKAEESK